MKIPASTICCLIAVLSAGEAVFGQTNSLEMPMLGHRLPMTTVEVENRISTSTVARLPKTLAVYRYASKARELSIAGLQVLLEQSAFAGTNAADLIRGHSNSSRPDEPIRLATARNLDYFVITPTKGTVALQNQSSTAPTSNAVPTFDAIHQRLLRLAELFGIRTNEMDRNQDGTIHTPRTEDRITRMGGAVKFIGRRSMRFSRSVGGYAILANDDKIELALGGDGRIQKFEMKWPFIEPIRTNRLFTAQQLIYEIESGNVLADVANEYPPDGVAKIILNDIRIYYYALSPRGYGPVPINSDIFPVASLHATFVSKSGKTEDGGLFAPILDSK